MNLKDAGFFLPWSLLSKRTEIVHCHCFVQLLMNLTKSRFLLKIVRPTQVILLEFTKTYSNVFDFDLLCKVIFLKGIYFSLDGHPSAYQPRIARLNISAFFPRLLDWPSSPSVFTQLNMEPELVPGEILSPFGLSAIGNLQIWQPLDFTRGSLRMNARFSRINFKTLSFKDSRFQSVRNLLYSNIHR